MNFNVEYRAPLQLDVPSLEAAMLEEPQESCPVVHRFGPGIYIREVTLKPGVFAIGHYQKLAHMNIMLKGRVTMADGSELVAPMIFVAQPGRKIGFIHEETVWLNVYATDETDVEVLEGMFLDKSEAFQAHDEPQPDPMEAHEDFKRMLEEVGVSEETVRAQSECETDQIPMPFGSYQFQKGPSRIHGVGIFACGDYQAGDFIGEARIDGMRTPLGRFTNHSGTPNARMVKNGSRIDLYALCSISGNHGGQLGDEITVDYRVSVEVACLA